MERSIPVDRILANLVGHQVSRYSSSYSGLLRIITPSVWVHRPVHDSGFQAGNESPFGPPYLNLCSASADALFGPHAAHRVKQIPVSLDPTSTSCASDAMPASQVDAASTNGHDGHVHPVPPALGKKAKGKKAIDSTEASRLLQARISQLEQDAAGEKDQELEIGMFAPHQQLWHH